MNTHNKKEPQPYDIEGVTNAPSINKALLKMVYREHAQIVQECIQQLKCARPSMSLHFMPSLKKLKKYLI